MENIFKTFEKRRLSSQNKALLRAWKDVHLFCDNHPQISYIINKKNKDDLPVEYEIIFKIQSFIGLDKSKPVTDKAIIEKVEEKQFLFYPLFDDTHRMQLIIPPNFPSVLAKPKGKIVSPIWHPNIVCHGDIQILGRICFNEGNLDAGVTLPDRIQQVADYLTYENYLAEDREPHPYDNDVAFWIREIAEPMQWVIPGSGINYEKLGISNVFPETSDKNTFTGNYSQKIEEDKSTAGFEIFDEGEIVAYEEFGDDIVNDFIDDNQNDEIFEI